MIAKQRKQRIHRLRRFTQIFKMKNGSLTANNPLTANQLPIHKNYQLKTNN